ncbi:FAD:protein FMN transferase [soil metagenome]
MGGRSTITVLGAGPSVLSEAFELARRCERLWSRFLPASDLSRLNWSEGVPTVVDPLTTRLVQAMVDGHRLSFGLFDPTLLPDLIAAGYARSAVDEGRRTTLPGSARSPGDLGAIRIEGDVITLPRGTVLDPGGIGKGLAADIVCESVLAAGALGAMAEFSGDIVVAGGSPEGLGWRIGVENPIRPELHVAIVAVQSGAIVTSSQRKRRWQVEGKDAHHLIDPATHSSILTDVQSVTVIAGTGWYAETLSKAGFLMDPAEYLRWLPTVAAAGAIVDSSGALQVSSNWQEYS